METLRLGRSGLQVTRLCLGTMVFGSMVDEPSAFAVMDRAHDLGFRFFDVADVYPVAATSPEARGRTEEIVGRWLRDRRVRDVVVATKCVGAMGSSPNDRGGSRRHVIQACEASLRRLGMDAIDLFYLHSSAIESPYDETFGALDHLVRSGKVHYAGVSNFEAWHLALAMQAIAGARLAPITAIQPRMNLVNRVYERDVLPLCQAAGIGVVPYNPLGAGMLTGKYRRGQEPPEGSRFARGEYGKMYQGRYWNERGFDAAEALEREAAGLGCTAAQLAIAWLLTRPGVTSPIVGASRPEQLDENVKALELDVPPEVVERLDEVSAAFV